MFDMQNDDFWAKYDLLAQQILSEVPAVRRAAKGEIRAMNHDARAHGLQRDGAQPQLVAA